MFKKHVHIVFEYSQYTRGFKPSVKWLSTFSYNVVCHIYKERRAEDGNLTQVQTNINSIHSSGRKKGGGTPKDLENWKIPTIKGEVHSLIQELKLYHDRFHTYFRMSVRQCELLLAESGPHLRRQRNHCRDPIDPKQHLAVCLCILLFPFHCIFSTGGCVELQMHLLPNAVVWLVKSVHLEPQKINNWTWLKKINAANLSSELKQ